MSSAAAFAKRSRQTTCAVTLMGFVLTSTACVPMVGSIYRPSADGGEVLRAHCPPEPRSVIRFEQQGILISAKAGYVSGNEIWVQSTFEVPKGKTVRLLDRRVEVSLADHPGYTGQLVDERTLLEPGAVALGEPMEGATIQNEIGLSEGWPTLYDPPLSADSAMWNS